MDLTKLKSSDFTLSEELARWRLELEVRERGVWWIAFTNPTAGPWKRLMGRDARGREGEVHRFEREEDRPDLVLVCDRAKMIAVIEAKDCLSKLLEVSQIEKSSAVVQSLAKTLKGKSANSYWEQRASYSVIAGLCWGADTPELDGNVRAAIQSYSSRLNPIPVFGIEVGKDRDGTLDCREHWVGRSGWSAEHRVCETVVVLPKGERTAV